MIGGQNVHVAVTVHTEAALFVTGATTDVRHVCILTVTRHVVSRMRIDDRVALMAGLTIELRAALVTHRTIGVGRGGFHTVCLFPDDGVIIGFQFFTGQVAGFAFHRDGTLCVAVHALGHHWCMHFAAIGQPFIKIRVTGVALEFGVFEMALMIEAGTVIVFDAEESIYCKGQMDAFVGDIFGPVAIGADRKLRHQVVHAIGALIGADVAIGTLEVVVGDVDAVLERAGDFSV